jgi:hypothetical protein
MGMLDSISEIVGSLLEVGDLFSNTKLAESGFRSLSKV